MLARVLGSKPYTVRTFTLNPCLVNRVRLYTNCDQGTWVRVPKEEDASRLDKFIHRLCNVPISQAQRAIRRKQVRVVQCDNSPTSRYDDLPSIRPVPMGYHVSPNIAIRLPPQFTPVQPRTVPSHTTWPTTTQRRKLPLTISYLDEALLIVNKPSGLATQGGTHITESVAAFLSQFQFGYPEPPRLVHRLDKDTSGLLLLARTRAVAATLTSWFRDRQTIIKCYAAVLAGNSLPNISPHVIDVPLTTHTDLNTARETQATVYPADSTNRLESSAPRRSARTTVHVVARSKPFPDGRTFSLVNLFPHTGRKHQLRVHCAQVLGAPILYDTKYGPKLTPSERSHRLCLHLQHLQLPRLDVYGKPLSGPPLSVTCPIPDTMDAAIKSIFGQSATTYLWHTSTGCTT
ncbi:hypothetical protein IWQ62_002963 [Dispira parvispora]|uniref:Pseudouridine synthase RsuA/RluA-like domain-containing protein n=1 Tax=Dispira parvispora TaxID=1520584 RepID=A0A9W8APH1_9FUNG|nr:hypothetical protein IWQ62_002963 [Dispira parvispora]